MHLILVINISDSCKFSERELEHAYASPFKYIQQYVYVLRDLSEKKSASEEKNVQQDSLQEEGDARAICGKQFFGNCGGQSRGTVLQSHSEAVHTASDNEHTEVGLECVQTRSLLLWADYLFIHPPDLY